MPVKPIEPRPMNRTTARRRGRRLLTTLSVAALGAGLLFVAPPAIAAPPAEAVDAIGARYDEAGGASSPLGAPSGEAVDVEGGALQDYAGGAIYYSADSGAKIMYGEILKKYRALGGRRTRVPDQRRERRGRRCRQVQQLLHTRRCGDLLES